MRKFLIFVALCIAICQAAPSTNEDSLKPVLHRQKRDNTTVAKPDSVKAREGLQHNAAQAQHNAELLIAHDALNGHKHEKRDIPVPTEIKTTAAPKEAEPKEAVAPVEPVAILADHEHSTPHGPLRHRPVPVAELFNKTAKPSSSEESKESKESEESKETTKA